MRISLDWLSTHLDLAGRSVREIDALLTDAGIEVEGVETRGVASERIVVARILEAVQHPNADRLKVTQIDAGEGSPRQIVCGARNYRVGDKVPCALPGAELPGGFVIREAVMRKVESRGMLCSASEIGLPDGEDGLLILSEEAEIGRPVMEYFDSDVLLDLEVTPNRADLLSHRGLARELAALLDTPLKESPNAAVIPTAPAASVRLDAPDDCPFYSLIRISGVKVGESPDWLKRRLESIGLRPIHNVVDVTNFVLHELGQPLHAFDAAKVNGGVVVRRATDGEAFHALDGSTHVLASSDLLISDASGSALALAGVMGGLASGVTAATTDILLESAWFRPQGIRATSRRTGLASDSSYRFERGVDPAGVIAAASLAVSLILETAGGTAEEVIGTAGKPPVVTRPVTLDLVKLDQLTGGSIAHDEAARILRRLGLEPLDGSGWNVPSHRADLQRHIDLVEEIVRVAGLAAIPSRAVGFAMPSSPVDVAADADRVLRQRLAALGFHECQTIKLVSDAQLADALPLRALQQGDVIRVKLPLSEDHAVLRPSLVPGLVASAAHNLRHQAASLRLFELGRVFRHSGGGKARDQETETLAFLLSGECAPTGWNRSRRDADVHDMKGVLEAMLPQRRVRLVPRERTGFALACDIKAGDQNIGVFARLLPARERSLDSITPVFVAELDLAKLRKLIAGPSAVVELPHFPGSSRDAAMEVPASLANAEIEQAIAAHNEPLLVDSVCFDVFADPDGVRLAADRKSLAYRFHYRAADRTLTSAEVDAAHQGVLRVLEQRLGVRFR